MTAPPYMKLYIADYHVETTELDVVGHGAYLLLLMAMWRAGGKLPRDEAKLSRLAKCTPERWAEVRDDVMAHFKVSGGVIRHARVSKEIAKYDAVVNGAETAGKASAAKRANKTRALERTDVQREDQRLTNQPEPQPKPNPELSVVVGGGARDGDVAPILDDWPMVDPAGVLVGLVECAFLDPFKSPGLVTTAGRLIAWKRDGASWQHDVIPVVTGLCAKQRGPISSWKFFDAAIARSIADNRRVLDIPEGQAHERFSKNPRTADREDRVGRMLAGAMAAVDRP